jgi:hypothetical protein
MALGGLRCRVLILGNLARLTFSGRHDVQAQTPELMIESALVSLMREVEQTASRVISLDEQFPAERATHEIDDGQRKDRTGQDAQHAGFRLEKSRL